MPTEIIKKRRGNPNFVKGVSGNPGGRPKGVAEVLELARNAAPAAIATLIEISGDKKAPPAARVSASTALLDRGFGKPAQQIVGADDGPVQIQVIKRIIVRTAEGEDKG